ncbi:Alpha-1A adrenergic receptor [Mizuhopecten yessoensis]|uniref:Alpha-1A adrenergic receptor n=1 Tax=Mizuhopecten yessoensis TaxID=6573 RepID=A0A210PSN9_MIZYE|nr:Alpha-1A adrenergic receptor [Mizuhopecten yessoensis]
MDNFTSVTNKDFFTHGAWENEVIAVSLFFCIIFVVSLICNILVIVTFGSHRCLRTIHDKLIICLAVINLFISMGVPFYMIYSAALDYISNRKWMCLVVFSFPYGGITASLFVHLGLAVDRYVCIVSPARHMKIKSNHVIIWCLISITFGLSLSMLPAVGWNNWDSYERCVIEVFPSTFSLMLKCIALVILTTNGVIHVLLLNIAHKHSKNIIGVIRHIQSLHTSGKTSVHVKTFSSTAVVTVFILCGVSTLCWLPVLVMTGFYHLPNMDPLQKIMLSQILFMPILLNTCLSPVIYVTRNKHFQNALKAVLLRRKHECF